MKKVRSKSSIRRRRLYAIAALLLGLSLALISGEIALRVYVAARGWTPNCYATGLAFFVPHATAGHTLRPNLRLISSTYDVAVNSEGFRGPAIALEKTPSRLRIAVLGGSSVFGYLVPEEMDSCRILEDMLDEHGIPAEVINAGVPGFNMLQCRERYVTQVSRLQPDYVILYLGWNDIPYLIAENPQRSAKAPPAPPGWQRVLSHSVLYGFLRYRLLPSAGPQFAPPASLETDVTTKGEASFRSDLLQLIDSVEASGAKPVLCTQVMAAGRDCRGLERFLGESPAQIEANRKIGRWISQCIADTASSEQLPLIDCSKEIPCDEETLGDAIHLTAKGHRLVAQLWCDTLLQLTQGKPAKTEEAPQTE